MIATRFLRHLLVTGGVVAVLSCGRSVSLAPDSGGGAPNGGLLDGSPQVGLLRCSPLPYDSVTQTIGPEGGTLSVGPYSLSIPAGALPAAVTITAVAPSDTVNQVRFFPEGLTFASPASLTMSYANCDALSQLEPKQIAYTTNALAVLALLPSVDVLSQQQVTGQLQHFSTYAVAW